MCASNKQTSIATQVEKSVMGDPGSLPYVVSDLSFIAATESDARIAVYPPSSGRENESPLRERRATPIYDCRSLTHELSLGGAGFELRHYPAVCKDFYAPERVKTEYYPQVVALLKTVLSAERVLVFDHNVRNKARAKRGDHGVRFPVDHAHNDYTLTSGPRRIREILSENNMPHLIGRHAALINVWRPIVGPVQDNPLAICDARSIDLEDFVPTSIEHFLEDDLENPHLSGEIYSFRYRPVHRWFYISNMQPEEVILLQCYDSAASDKVSFTGHTGFKNPSCPPHARVRESIEARTVVVYPD